MANYVYTQSEINIKIKDKAPKTYFDEILKQCENSDLVYGDISESDDLIKNLEENAIPEDIYNVDVVSYNNFLEKRRKLMALKIKEYYMSLI